MWQGKPPPLTQEDLDRNFKVLHYLFNYFMPIIPLRINVKTGQLRELYDPRHQFSYLFGLFMFFVYICWIFATVLGTYKEWEESKGEAFFFWEKPLVILFAVLYHFYYLRTWVLLLFDLSTNVDLWNSGLERLSLGTMISGNPAEKKTIERLTLRLKFWSWCYCPVFASTLIFYPWIYWRFDDHPFTLLAHVDAEWKTTAVTLGCLGIDLTVHAFWLTVLVYYLHCSAIIVLDECISEHLIEQAREREMTTLEPKIGKEAGKIKYPKTTGVYSY